MEDEIVLNEKPFMAKSPRLGKAKDSTNDEKDVEKDAEQALVVGVVIRTLDGMQKNVDLNLHQTALDASLEVGRLFGVKLNEEFGLAFPEKRGWLDETSSLLDLGIKENNELIYKKKFFIADDELSRKDEKDIELMYPQCVDGFIRGFFKCSQGHAIGLAALQARVYQVIMEESKKDQLEDQEEIVKEGCNDEDESSKEKRKQEKEENEDKERDGMENLPSVSEIVEFLPPEQRSGGTVKCVIDQVEGMKLMSEMDAKYQFVHICSSLEGYGITAYVVGDSFNRIEKSGVIEKSPVMLGVGRHGIFRINYKTNEIMEMYSFNKLKSWSCGKSTFVLDFGEHRPRGHWGVVTSSPKALAQICQGYIRLLKHRDEQRLQ